MKQTLLIVAVGMALATSASAKSALASKAVDNTPYGINVYTQDGEGKHLASIWVKALNAPEKSANETKISFKKIAKKANSLLVSKNIAHQDKKGVYVVRMYKMTGFPYNMIPMPDHSYLGRMSFMQVGSEDLWFGDWAYVDPEQASGVEEGSYYTVYYAGTNPTTKLPSSGQVTYHLNGINNYVQFNDKLLTGSMTANFGNKTFDGHLSHQNLAITFAGDINSQDASFAGSATANRTIQGQVQGQFFGKNAEAVAGITTFSGHHEYDTAFGGKK